MDLNEDRTDVFKMLKGIENCWCVCIPVGVYALNNQFTLDTKNRTGALESKLRMISFQNENEKTMKNVRSHIEFHTYRLVTVFLQIN